MRQALLIAGSTGIVDKQTAYRLHAAACMTINGEITQIGWDAIDVLERGFL